MSKEGFGYVAPYGSPDGYARISKAEDEFKFIKSWQYGYNNHVFKITHMFEITWDDYFTGISEKYIINHGNISTTMDLDLDICSGDKLVSRVIDKIQMREAEKHSEAFRLCNKLAK